MNVKLLAQMNVVGKLLAEMNVNSAPPTEVNVHFLLAFLYFEHVI